MHVLCSVEGKPNDRTVLGPCPSCSYLLAVGGPGKQCPNCDVQLAAVETCCPTVTSTAPSPAMIRTVAGLSTTVLNTATSAVSF